jgi:EAL domain-containing protein (putative c-di-GMP-specific phosphodiesterase class I)
LQRAIELGCDLFQGFLLSHPLPPQRLVPLLRDGAVALPEVAALPPV